MCISRKIWLYFLVLVVSVTAGRLRPKNRFGAVYQSESVRDKEDDFYLRFREGRVDEIPEIMSVRVESKIVNRYAVTKVDQIIFNPKKEDQIEALVVALSPQALVSHLSLRGEEFLMEKAKEEVDKGDFENISSSLQKVYSSSLGIEYQELILPVLMEPLENLTLSIVYEELLGRTSGKYQYPLHLNIGEVIPDLAVRIEISDHADITGVVVTAPVIGDTTKEALKNYGNEKEKMIEFDMTAQEQGYYFGTDGFSGNILTEYEVSLPQSKADIIMQDGYFVHFFRGPQNLPHIPKHVMLVVDNAIAVNEDVIKASEVARKVIENLVPEDYLNIISFNGTVLEWNPTIRIDNAPLQEAFKCESVVKESGVQFVLGLQKKGFSDIIATVQSAIFVGQRIKMSNKLPDNVLSIMVIIIDSHTQIPETDPEKLTMIDPEAIDYPIHSIRIGNNTQRNVFEKLSRMTEGSLYNLDPTENIDDQLDLFLIQFDDILLKNVKMTFKDDLVLKESLTTTKFEYFRKGSDLVVAGQFDPNMNSTLEVVVEGQSFDKKYQHKESIKSNMAPAGFHGFNQPPTNFVEKIWTYMKIKENIGSSSSSSSEHLTNGSMVYKFLTPLTQLVLKNNSSQTVLRFNKTEIDFEDEHNYWSNEFPLRKDFYKARSLSPNMELQQNLPKLDYSQLWNITSLLADKWKKEKNLTLDHKLMLMNISSEGHPTLDRNILDSNFNTTIIQHGNFTKEKNKNILRKILVKILNDTDLNEFDLNTQAALVDLISSIGTPFVEIAPTSSSSCSSSLTMTTLTGFTLTVSSSQPLVHLVGVTYARKDPSESLCCWALYTQPSYAGRRHKFCGRFGQINIQSVKSVKQL